MLVLVAVMMSLMLGMVVFAVDIGWIVANKTKLQSAADAAALAGAGVLSESYSLSKSRDEALQYSNLNAPEARTSVEFGTWDPVARQFTKTNEEPNAVYVQVRRTNEKGNPIPAFFSMLFGHKDFAIQAESIAVGAVPVNNNSESEFSVYVTSTKHLSNVVLRFEDDTHQKFDDLSGYSGTFAGTGEHSGKVITGVWIKSGCYMSGDGPGYGEYLAGPLEGTTIHGKIADGGCNAHVTATFSATGIVFEESGSVGPIRLVK